MSGKMMTVLEADRDILVDYVCFCATQVVICR